MIKIANAVKDGCVNTILVPHSLNGLAIPVDDLAKKK